MLRRQWDPLLALETWRLDDAATSKEGELKVGSKEVSQKFSDKDSKESKGDPSVGSVLLRSASLMRKRLALWWICPQVLMLVRVISMVLGHVQRMKVRRVTTDSSVLSASKA